MASAIICNAKGELEKDNINIGEFKHTYLSGSFLWQGGLLINGRNALSAGNDFQYKFTEDSSRAIVLCTPDEGGLSNIKFKIYRPDLSEEKVVAVNIPLKSTNADLIDFSLTNDGKIYLVIKTYKSGNERKKIKDDDDFYSDIYVIDTEVANKISELSININGKAINSVNLGFTKKGYPVCFGSYYNLDNKKAKGNMQGLYSIKIDPIKFSIITSSTYNLPDSVIEILSDKKTVKKGIGLDKVFNLSKVITKDDEGLYIALECNVIQTTVRGRTGALNKYEEVTESVLPYYIGSDGQIKWTHPMTLWTRNTEFATRVNRLDFFHFKQDLTYAVRKGNNRGGILRIVHLKEKDGDWQSEDLGEFQYYSSFVQNTLVPLGNDEYVLAVFIEGERKNPSLLSFLKFKAE